MNAEQVKARYEELGSTEEAAIITSIEHWDRLCVTQDKGGDWQKRRCNPKGDNCACCKHYISNRASHDNVCPVGFCPTCCPEYTSAVEAWRVGNILEFRRNALTILKRLHKRLVDIRIQAIKSGKTYATLQVDLLRKDVDRLEKENEDLKKNVKDYVESERKRQGDLANTRIEALSSANDKLRKKICDLSNECTKLTKREHKAKRYCHAVVLDGQDVEYFKGSVDYQEADVVVADGRVIKNRLGRVTAQVETDYDRKLQGEIDRLGADKRALNEIINHYKGYNDELIAKNAQLQNEKNGWISPEDERAKLQDDLRVLRAYCKKLTEDYEEKLENCRQSERAADAEITRLERINTDLDHRLALQTQAATRLLNSNRDLKAELTELREKLANLYDERSDLVRKLSQISMKTIPKSALRKAIDKSEGLTARLKGMKDRL